MENILARIFKQATLVQKYFFPSCYSCADLFEWDIYCYVGNQKHFYCFTLFGLIVFMESQASQGLRGKTLNFSGTRRCAVVHVLKNRGKNEAFFFCTNISNHVGKATVQENLINNVLLPCINFCPVILVAVLTQLC